MWLPIVPGAQHSFGTLDNPVIFVGLQEMLSHGSSMWLVTCKQGHTDNDFTTAAPVLTLIGRPSTLYHESSTLPTGGPASSSTSDLGKGAYEIMWWGLWS